MGVKRPHAFEGRNDDAHTSTKSIHPRFTKRTHLNASKPNSTSSSAAAINPIKAKIRDVTRLLKRSDNLPAGVRTEKERALAGYEQDLQQAQAEKRKQQMISKYHMVRFFERQKATRHLKKLKAGMADVEHGSAEYQDLLSVIHEAEVDVNYALYHPLDEKYRSLYPRNSNNVTTSEDSLANRSARKAGTTRPAIWGVVEECMTGGTLEALRDGRLRSKLLNERSQQNMSSKARLTEPSKKTSDRNSKMSSSVKTILPEEQDGDSDGGFFEE